MTDSDENPFAPPAYPPPAGPAFAPSAIGDAGPVRAPEGVWSEAVTQPVAGVFTEPVAAPRGPINRTAKRAILLGALTPVLTPVAGIAAVAIGRRARTEISETGEGGEGLATAGVWMGAAFSVLWLLGVAFLIAMKAGSIAA